MSRTQKWPSYRFVPKADFGKKEMMDLRPIPFMDLSALKTMENEDLLEISVLNVKTAGTILQQFQS